LQWRGSVNQTCPHHRCYRTNRQKADEYCFYFHRFSPCARPRIKLQAGNAAMRLNHIAEGETNLGAMLAISKVLQTNKIVF
jgi:hypothetical protein